jgi:hypothetical protein
MDHLEIDTEELTADEARHLLKVSTAKMAKLKDGKLPWRPDDLDGRIKLVKKSDVDRFVVRDKRRHREGV